MSGYQALVSTKNSAGTPFLRAFGRAAARMRGRWRYPRRFFAFADLLVVLPGGGYCRQSGFFGVGDSDEPKCRVRRGRLQLAFERQETSSDDIRFGGVELVGEAFEAVALVGDEVDL